VVALLDMALPLWFARAASTTWPCAVSANAEGQSIFSYRGTLWKAVFFVIGSVSMEVLLQRNEWNRVTQN
jgi:hypothetical protein